MSRTLCALPAWLVLGALLGCNQKDAGKCENAKGVTAQALASEDFALARQWRDYAYKHCDDPAALKTLDDDIVKKETEVNTRKREEESRRAETEQLLGLFTTWVSQHRADPTRAAVNVSCAGPDDSKDRWCARERSVGGKYTVRVRYWEAEPVAQEFFTIAPGPVTCAQLGTSSELSQKHGGAQVFCDITGGTLSGMQVLIRRAKDGTHLNVVTKEYVAKDARFAALTTP